MRSSCGFGQLEQIVDGANHRPLASDLVEPTQQELPETLGLLEVCHTPSAKLGVALFERVAEQERTIAPLRDGLDVIMLFAVRVT